MTTVTQARPRPHPTMLRFLQEYRRALDATRLDISRKEIDRFQPIYVVDFQLIYLYAKDDPSDGSVFLEYALRQGVPMILGPGTLVEIARFLEVESGIPLRVEAIVHKYSEKLNVSDPVEFAQAATDLLREIESAFSIMVEGQRSHDWRTQMKAMGLRAKFSQMARRMVDFLGRDTIFPPDRPFGRKIGPGDMFDAATFHEVKSSFLKVDFRAPLSRSNLSDALNVSYVVALRRVAVEERLGNEWYYYPYLLTMTGAFRSRSMETTWSDDLADQLGYSTNPVRFPLQAFYSHHAITEWFQRNSGLSDHLKMLKERVDENIEKLRSEHIEHLIKSRKRTTARHDKEDEKSAVASVLSLGVEFFADEIASDILQIRTNLEAAVRNRELALGLIPSLQAVAEDFTEVVKLLIVKYNLHQLFSNTLAKEIMHEVSEIDGTRVHIWKVRKGDDDESSDEVEYRVEVDAAGLVSVTWPTGSNIASILRYLDDPAYERHGVKQVRVIVGVIERENRPVIREAVIEREINISKLRARHLLGPGTTWIRLEKIGEEVAEPAFAVYVALITHFGQAGEIGVIIPRKHLKLDHLIEFIFATAGDFLLLAPPEFFLDRINEALEV